MDIKNITPISQVSDEGHFAMLKNLLPHGAIWDILLGKHSTNVSDRITPTAPAYHDNISGGSQWKDTITGKTEIDTSWFGELLFCFARELTRWYQRYLTVTREVIPGLSDETLEEWEMLTGVLVDPADSRDTRRVNVNTFVTQGKNDETLEDITVCAAYFISYARTLGMTITIDKSGTKIFRVGMRLGGRVNGMGSAYSWIVRGNYNAYLQSEFERMKPAHTVIIWM